MKQHLRIYIRYLFNNPKRNKIVSQNILWCISRKLPRQQRDHDDQRLTVRLQIFKSG